MTRVIIEVIHTKWQGKNFFLLHKQLRIPHSKHHQKRKQSVNKKANVRNQSTMLIPPSHLHEQPSANPSRPNHENRRNTGDHGPSLWEEQRHRRQDHHGEHAVPDQANAPVEIQRAVSPGEHVENDVEEQRRDGNPTEDDAEVDLPGEELEETEHHKAEDGAGEIGVVVEVRVRGAEGVEDRRRFAPDLFCVDAEFFEERGFVVEVGEGV